MPTQTPTGPLSETTEIPSHASKSKGFFINRNFTLLAIGQAISNMGDFVYATTLLVWVFELTHSAAAVSGVWIAQYAPIFILGPIAGVFVDRWNRRRTMIVADVARAVAALLPFIVPSFLLLPTIYSSIFLVSGLSRFFMPARTGMIQAIVPEEQRTQAVSISQTTFALAFIIGPAIAAPLYFIVGPFIGSLINALSFLVSALCLRAIRVSREALQPALLLTKEHSDSGLRAVAGELFTGFKYVAKSRTLFMVIILASLVMLGGGAINALDIIFVTRNLHADASFYGPLTALAGLGTLIGAIAAGLVAKKATPRIILTGSVFLLGVGIILYALQTWIVAALIIIFVMSIPQGGIEVGAGPLLMQATPRILMGRVQSVLETAMYGMSLVSIGLAGYFAQFIAVNLIFAVGGALFALGGIVGWLGIPAQIVAEPEIQQV
ncbi:MAG TPA: MFS transporter [Ktedonobacteraceae bacterium]|nr:MFS transporter [Ktedonobacteraceae bacterium]